MVSFDPVWFYPKPKQRPHPPILLGGSSAYTLKRVVEFCDGWMPLAISGFNVKEAVPRLRETAAAAGRDFSTLSINVFAPPPDPAILAEYRDAAIQRTILMIPDRSRDQVLAVLDKYARWMA
jgi:alkanesulfonate monooxygenase SsuD/methylene tetrahydromethanopterin reductase-like flavin-dependent oxidoreductase (luciferase family)